MVLKLIYLASTESSTFLEMIAFFCVSGMQRARQKRAKGRVNILRNRHKESANMHKAPLVSVTMVALNRERYIGAAIDSILLQTLSDWELILVDNGSSDATFDIIESYAARDRRIRFFRRPGLNLPDVRNAALAAAEGNYVAVLDSDDLALPERLALQTSYLDEHPGVAGIGSGFDFIDAGGAPVQVNKYEKRLTDPDELRRHELAGWSCFLHSSMLFRRQALEEVGGYRSAFLTAEDDDLYLRLLEHHNLANLSVGLTRYRWHGDNACKPSLDVQLRRVIALASAHTRLASLSDPIGSLHKPLDYSLLQSMLERLGPASLPVWLLWIGLLQFYALDQRDMLDTAWRHVLALPVEHATIPEVVRHWKNFQQKFPIQAEAMADAAIPGLGITRQEWPL